MVRSFIPNLENMVTGYGSFHHNPVNKVIHIFLIPVILITGCLMIKHASIKYLGYDLSCWFLAALLLYYMAVDLPAGLICALIYYPTYYYMSGLYMQTGVTKRGDFFNKVAIVHLCSWLVQIMGHAVFEKRAPAFTDNVLQILVAPFFVVVEVMFQLGYRPATMKTIKDRVERNIGEYRAKVKKLVEQCYHIDWYVNVCT
eukprot:TRINITY_DN12829_c0_g1_i5.p1 TRINITY_DN12829_c0_g1~~TRINITY_DN12829_c0_g1_i5.p1  ORF type:complete len:200 (-),score=50.31 TRINITY_DN12829_c0_g1_i5:226-825(-)